MVNIPRWQVVTVLVLCFLGLVFAVPNLFGKATMEGLPDWLPSQQISLGLDLQGGSHLLLEVDAVTVIEEDLEALVDEVRSSLRQERIGYRGLGAEGTAVRLQLRDPADGEAVQSLLDGLDSDASITLGDGGAVRLALSEEAVRSRKDAAIEQSVEIVRRRIDEFGTKEPTIQRQGADRILVQLPGVDDPERIKDILGQTAKLTFHLLDPNTPQGQPGMAVPPGTALLLGEGEEGARLRYYVVRKRVEVSGDRLIDAQPSFQTGEAVVSFRFDTAGAKKFGRVTSEHTGEFLAIVLDDKVISAPVIREPILGGNGIISGSFTTKSAQDLSLLLRAGALPAPLLIIEERTVGPSLGADSIAAGKVASVIGLIAVLILVAAAYGLFGLMANVALLINLVLITGTLSALQATLTLPGIAGIVLTVGMAVDANVLIFERIREEIRGGRTPISAVDAGYRRALTTIIDSNFTTLIAALLLFGLGSGPIKGFAVTLSIGIITSMFTAIMVTRLMVVVWLRRRRPQAIPI
jgi:preprotein translocase subunit SecD